MIEGRHVPVIIRMARVASGREVRRHMAWIGGAGEVLLVATVAGCRDGGVVVVGMARGAGHRGMEAKQREHRRVIEGRRSPIRRGVAKRAISRESGGYVGRIGGAREVRLVATVAVGRQRRVVVVRVARRTSHGDVRARQRERRRVVIKACSGPIRSAVASLARGWEARRSMRRIGGSVEICLVAADAGRRQRSVVRAGAGVALHARHSGVETSQRERRGAVIKGRRCPVGGRVADGAIGREACGHVSWIGCTREVLLVATVAVCRQRREVVIHVARRASHVDVGAGQRERRLVVVKARRGP